MRIYEQINLWAQTQAWVVNALIDTGAAISILPYSLAVSIGARSTGQFMQVVAVHGDVRSLPLAIANLSFPSLGDKGGQFVFAVSSEAMEAIIGMDILRPMGITINTGTHTLTISNETWEAFKDLAAKGLIGFFAFRGLKRLGDEDQDEED